ncbi:UNVERIFIED_CONTAM: hypothetical protein K2H54_073357 [Gekko kuhli]
MHRAGLLLLVGLLAFWAEISPGSGQGIPVDKAGTCPALIQWPDQMCGLFCSTDRNCPAEEKCCRTRCSHECRRPSESIPGYCPKVTLPPNTSTICLARCSTDQSCRENGHPGKKCCAYGCQLRCTEPVEEHPGVCPKNELIFVTPPCKDTCRDDRDCPLRKKCCFTRCSLGCLDPVRSERCQLPPERGPCKQRLQRYHYNHAQKRCVEFTYGGCQGNSNNFETEKACREALRENQSRGLQTAHGLRVQDGLWKSRQRLSNLSLGKPTRCTRGHSRFSSEDSQSLKETPKPPEGARGYITPPPHSSLGLSQGSHNHLLSLQ